MMRINGSGMLIQLPQPGAFSSFLKQKDRPSDEIEAAARANA